MLLALVIVRMAVIMIVDRTCEDLAYNHCKVEFFFLTFRSATPWEQSLIPKAINVDLGLVCSDAQQCFQAEEQKKPKKYSLIYMCKPTCTNSPIGLATHIIIVSLPNSWH